MGRRDQGSGAPTGMLPRAASAPAGRMTRAPYRIVHASLWDAGLMVRRDRWVRRWDRLPTGYPHPHLRCDRPNFAESRGADGVAPLSQRERDGVRENGHEVKDVGECRKRMGRRVQAMLGPAGTQELLTLTWPSP